ncbi:uncharacterized protein DEA37_0003907 [Paragonimus westermani]|uniref:Uncharacterized protein n=1 Tax=Paragonimus westermani TaxID=34504 RepID=A0A5J4NWE9_9TREM|nr:uncharacterized protein DEA37_0003907 [Paragonimus westermani]
MSSRLIPSLENFDIFLLILLACMTTRLPRVIAYTANGQADYLIIARKVKQLFHDFDIHCTTIQPEFEESTSAKAIHTVGQSSISPSTLADMVTPTRLGD